jgi:hypothetical protein
LQRKKQGLIIDMMHSCNVVEGLLAPPEDAGCGAAGAAGVPTNPQDWAWARQLRYYSDMVSWLAVLSSSSAHLHFPTWQSSLLQDSCGTAAAWPTCLAFSVHCVSCQPVDLAAHTGWPSYRVNGSGQPGLHLGVCWQRTQASHHTTHRQVSVRSTAFSGAGHNMQHARRCV